MDGNAEDRRLETRDRRQSDDRRCRLDRRAAHGRKSKGLWRAISDWLRAARRGTLIIRRRQHPDRRDTMDRRRGYDRRSGDFRAALTSEEIAFLLGKS